MRARAHRTRTRAEYVASLEWNIKDAREALRNAVEMSEWAGVRKYTAQIESMQPKLSRAESGVLGPRRSARARLVREEEHRRSSARYEERVNRIARHLREQGFTGDVRELAEALIARRGYDQALRAISSMTARHVSSEQRAWELAVNPVAPPRRRDHRGSYGMRRASRRQG